MLHILSVVEFSGQALGVLREVWYQVNNLQSGVATIREQPVFKTPPHSQMILRDFDAPVDVADYYVQRLTSYIQVNVRFTIKTRFKKSGNGEAVSLYFCRATGYALTF